MTKILVLDDPAHGIPSTEYAAALRERLPDATVVHPDTSEGRAEEAVDAEVITGGSLPDELLEAAEDLRLFAAQSAGTDHLPVDRLRERGVAVTNASGVHGPNIAEHVLGWLLMLARRLDEGIRRQRRREWRHFQAFGELKGSTVTVVGLGAIGESIVERLDPFDVDTVGARYTPEKGGPTDEVVGFDELESVLGRTDYLVLACPLTDATEKLIGADALDALPNDAAVVNVGRGGVVDTDALVGAIRRNHVRAAALDVTDPEPLPRDHPLWDFENVLLTPHVSGHTPHYFTRLADILAENVDRAAETGEWDDLKNQVSR
ncbi:D-2-hydroxyacid dehydrogenase [Halogeometricum luteum]|uniref:D-2-hydroxyacid dehydrogenase n=1 Tax=Halogeometricum luteum TaxID=2950537 RepID=A0ABU2G571_9EURY|nr:D-2-hydroxyacid dehydrogenase [Halogeometricum sp. S3BR5-2]MDS0295937.1 D-2-hydroxyacid dehydrogenase [Halogeometricum sp. S3BR5-2]